MAEEHMPSPETGSEPGTTPHETLLRIAVLAHADSFEHVASTRGGRTHRDRAISLADLGSPSPFLNIATLLQPALGTDWDSVQDRIESFFGPRPGGGVILFSPWPAPPIAWAGWESVGHPSLMELSPGGQALPPAPTDLQVEEVADDEMLSALEAILVDGYPVEHLRPAWPGCLFDGRVLEDGSYRCWLGRVGNRPVTGAAAHIGNDLAVISWIATDPDFRGRGYAAAVISAAAEAAAHRPVVLIASEPSRPVFERMGFLPLVRLTAWLWTERRKAG